MSDLISDGMIRVAWAATLTNIHAPTTAECNAAIDLTPRITPDGLQTTPSTADVDTGSLASVTDTNEVGRIGYDNMLTLKRGLPLGGADDLPYSTLLYGVHGFLIVRRGVPYATGWATGQQVEVYPSVCGERINVAAAKNEVMKFQSPLKLTSAQDSNATVA